MPQHKRFGFFSTYISVIGGRNSVRTVSRVMYSTGRNKNVSAVILKKGQAPVIMPKTSVIRARATWSSDTDYDLYALVLKRDGSVETVAMFGATGVPAQSSALGGAVRHLGDVGREAQGDGQEIIEIQMTPEIRAVVPVAYSAQSNGTGSFHKYRVSLEIDNGAGDKVTISSENASRDKTRYTCAIGIVENGGGSIRIHPVEEYSDRGSEDRPTVSLEANKVVVRMDQGPRNDYK